MPLENKVAIVTGGAKGIGLAVARRFARRARGSSSPTSTRTLAAARSKRSVRLARVRFVRCDVGDKADVDNLVAATVQTWGSIDVLVGNAGIVHGARFPGHRARRTSTASSAST